MRICWGGGAAVCVGWRFSPDPGCGGEQAAWGSFCSICLAAGVRWGPAFWAWLSFRNRWHGTVLMIGSGGESGPRRQLLCVFICRGDLQEGVARRNGVSGKMRHCLLRTRSFMLSVPYTCHGRGQAVPWAIASVHRLGEQTRAFRAKLPVRILIARLVISDVPFKSLFSDAPSLIVMRLLKLGPGDPG